MELPALFDPHTRLQAARHVCAMALAACWLLFGTPAAAQGSGRLALVLTDSPAVDRPTRNLILGSFQGLDPKDLAGIWRVGRDPRTCAQAYFLAAVYRQGPAELNARLKELAVYTGGTSSAGVILPYEVAIADALEFDGQQAEAEAFLRDRLGRTIYPRPIRPEWDTIIDDEASRHASLRIRLANLYMQTRPAEAERLLVALADKSVRGYRAEFKRRADALPKGATTDFRLERDTTYIRVGLLAPYYLHFGRPAEALALYQQALAPLQQARARSLQSGGTNGNEYLADIQDYHLSIALASADVAARAGRLAEAEALYRGCCLKGGPGHDDLASPGLRELIRVLLAQGRREEAGTLALRLALQVASNLEHGYGPEFDCMAVPSEGHFDDAVRSAKVAAQRGIDAHGTDSVGERMVSASNFGVGRAGLPPKVGERLDRATELGELLLECGLADDARAVLEPTYGLQRLIFGDDHPSALRSLVSLSRAERLRGQLQRAAELGAAWRAASESFLDGRLWNVSEQARRDFFRTDHDHVEHLLDTLLAAARPDAADQVLALSIGRKGLLTRVAGRIDTLARGRADAGTRAMVAQMRQLRQLLSAAALADASDQPAALQARRDLADLEARLATAVRPGRAPTPPATTQGVLGALAPNQALVDFLVFRDPDPPRRERMVAVVARSPDRLALVEWPDLAALRESGVRLRQAMLDDDAAAADAAAAALGDAWWTPLEPHLSGLHNILIVPDGLLNVLPLAALKNRSGERVLETHEFVQLGSARDLLDPVVAAPRGTALVLGAPDYGPGTGPAGAAGRRLQTRGRELAELYFAPLPGALEEARRVARIVAPAYTPQLLSGATATKTALLQARAPTLLHLATHGFFLDDSTRPDSAGGDPLQALARSGLALAHANVGLQQPGAAGNGILTALEAVAMDLHGTRLVALSACDTALGQTVGGDGVYGLMRAFQQAGAQAVLGTLWPVSDEATSEFMQRFYRRLVSGMTASLALQQTQLEFAHDARWAHPRHWAGFVVTGRG